MVSVHKNPSVSQAMAIGDASALNNKGRSLYNQGKYVEAEEMYKQSLDVKLRHLGPNTHTVAIAYNALGEVYIKLGRLDEAEAHLKKAIPIVTSLNSAHDTAYYRENLAKVYEMKGDLVKAREERLQGTSNMIIDIH
ncbi:hypothetical protein EIP86_002902 [Pleurotus ostreatoroseus]|nr:hypothetical protein EIP86_002902 [Pleurotus ostreatoroseus]